ncbi:hypothetical protein QWJ34_11410 [Saccharibacillus sp. CPCC 101409]|uniref:hypothetical protein n=1 Tax=Saccharibacillus sp. CPCC 101409 TaxID=3058041 RepID=UPI0026716FE9|nr:hypothetical protein [Saccharibacillus sp. CPCC 101409]MDO3410371.1 hypothetical protein [Saccharibacillus sp. CPCC 101409]
MTKFKKLAVSTALIFGIATLSVASVSAQFGEQTKEALQFFASRATTTQTTTFSHNFNNNYSKSFFGDVMRGTFNTSAGWGGATGNTQISLANGMEGYATVTLVGINGVNYQNSQFGSGAGWVSSGNADAGNQACYAASHNSSRTITGSGNYDGYIAKSTTF